METELMNSGTVGTICDAYATACAEIREGFRQLEQAEKRLKTYLEFVTVLPDGYAHPTPQTAEEIIARVRKDSWRFILAKTRVLEMCSEKQVRDFEQQLKDDSLPDLTEANVLKLLENLQASLPGMLEQAMKEVFDWLRPQGWLAGQYKTNNKEFVGKRVIQTYVIDHLYGRHYSIRYDRERSLQALDNVFHLLDGRGIARYPQNLVTTLKQVCQEGRPMCETEYFKCRWFHNGNLHIEFKRMDLVKELNKRVGASGLASHKPRGAEIVKVGDGSCC